MLENAHNLTALSHNKEKAFSLIELLVALSIFVVIISIVYSILYLGIKSYQNVEKELKFNQKLNIILDKMSIELRNCYDTQYGSGFITDSTNISFFTIKKVYLEGERSFRKTLARITYSFKDGKLFKKTQLDKDVFLNSDKFKEKQLISDIKEFNFKFLYFEQIHNKYDWRPTWPDKTIIPQGIKIEIKFSNSNSIDLTRYIFLRQGQVVRD